MTDDALQRQAVASDSACVLMLCQRITTLLDGEHDQSGLHAPLQVLSRCMQWTAKAVPALAVTRSMHS